MQHICEAQLYCVHRRHGTTHCWRRSDFLEVPAAEHPFQCFPRHILNYFCLMTHNYSVQAWCRTLLLDRWGPYRSSIVHRSHPKTLLVVACDALGVQVRELTVRHREVGMGGFTWEKHMERWNDWEILRYTRLHWSGMRIADEEAMWGRHYGSDAPRLRENGLWGWTSNLNMVLSGVCPCLLFQLLSVLCDS